MSFCTDCIYWHPVAALPAGSGYCIHARGPTVTKGVHTCACCKTASQLDLPIEHPHRPANLGIAEPNTRSASSKES